MQKIASGPGYGPHRAKRQTVRHRNPFGMSDPGAAASRANARDKAWLQTVFDRHDLNRDGRLTLGELIHLTQWLDASVSTEECEGALDSMDQNQSGCIDFEAFFTWWMHRSAAPPRQQ